MFRLSALILLAAVLPQKCDFGADAARTAEAKVRPYFPKAQATLTNGGHNLRAITCVDLGPKAIEALPRSLDPEMGELKKPIARVLTGINSFELGFEQAILHLDLNSNAYSAIPAGGVPGYSSQYDAACKGTIRVSADAQIYIGRFKVTVQTGVNEIQTIEMVDTLGIYRPEEFATVRQAEVEARRGIMSSELRKRGIDVIGVELVAVGRMSAPDTRGWEVTPTNEMELRRFGN